MAVSNHFTALYKGINSKYLTCFMLFHQENKAFMTYILFSAKKDIFYHYFSCQKMTVTDEEYGSSSCTGPLELGAEHTQNRKLVPIPRAQLTVFNLPQPSLHS